MMILPWRLRCLKERRSASVALSVGSALASAAAISLSKLNVEKSHTPGAGISCTIRPKKALPKKAWTDAPGTAGPVIHTGQEPASLAALVKYPEYICCPVLGLRGPAMIFCTALTCGGV